MDSPLAAKEPAGLLTGEAAEDSLPQAPRGMIDQGLSGFRQRRVLMLQGPIGPFFSRLGSDLKAAGATVVKVNFNGGDRLFTRSGGFAAVIDYRDSMEAWPARFEALVTQHRIDTILLFGDCRPVHVPVVAIAKRLGLEIGVFEEGYLRPDFVTIERDGVNNHSTLPKEPAFYRQVEVPAAAPTVPVGSTFGSAACWGMLYYGASSLLGWRYRHHQYHRSLSWLDCRFWLRSAWRKLYYRLHERPIEQRFIGENPSRFFLVVLQTCGDAQVRVHSPFQTVERFIEHVIRDFAAHAPADVELAIKHHPLDRGFSDYRALIDALVTAHGIAGRCHYLHDQHLPTLLRKTMGVVTINSTVGLSAIGAGVPVAVCGDAIYDIAGLVFKGPLAEFWTRAATQRPDFALWQAFRNVLVATTQFNGSFYKRHSSSGFASGVLWDKRLPTGPDGERIPQGRSLRPTLPLRPGQRPGSGSPAGSLPQRTTLPAEAGRRPTRAAMSEVRSLARRLAERLPARRENRDDREVEVRSRVNASAMPGVGSGAVSRATSGAVPGAMPRAGSDATAEAMPGVATTLAVDATATVASRRQPR